MSLEQTAWWVGKSREQLSAEAIERRAQMDKDEWWRLKGSTCAEAALRELQEEVEAERADRAADRAVEVARDLKSVLVNDTPTWDALDSMHFPGAGQAI